MAVWLPARQPLSTVYIQEPVPAAHLHRVRHLREWLASLWLTDNMHCFFVLAAASQTPLWLVQLLFAVQAFNTLPMFPV